MASRSGHPLTSIEHVNDSYDLNDDIPFQRFESPCPLSSARNDSTLSNVSPSSFTILPESIPRPFTSIDTNVHTSGGIQNALKTQNELNIPQGTPDIGLCANEIASIYGDAEDEENEYRPRPHSANSIASVWKSVASKTQILSDRFSLCGAHHAEDENHIPFHPSEVMVPSSTASDSHPGDTIQLRHVQSTSALKLASAFNFDTSQMRRSCSTPAKFQPGKSGSAFGRVPINSSLSKTISKSEESDVVTFGLKRRSAFNRVETKVDHVRSVANCQVVSDSGSKVLNDNESILLTDDTSESSKRSFSALQHKVKMKRRERRQQNGKDKSFKAKPVSGGIGLKAKEDNVSCSRNEGATEVCAVGIGCHGKLSKNNFERKLKADGHLSENKDVQDSRQEKVSYLPLQPEKKQVEKEDILGVDFADIAFSKQHISKNRSRESPTTIPSPAYHQITDDEQPVIQIPLSRPKQFRRHTRTPPTPASPSGRPCTPQPPKVLSLKATLQGNNMSPCSQDSCAQSRMTSRSGHSKNTFSTSLSGSCNRSVTSSVAEADKEVRDTNRRELHRRRNVNDFDGGISIHSSDTTSTNPNTYLALTSNPPPPREGASLPVDRFFAGNASIGVGSHGSNASCSTINNGLEVNPFSGRSSHTIYSRSPVKLSNRPMRRVESIFNDEEPPQIVSCTSKQVLPPLSRESIAYSKLGFDGKNIHSSCSSKSSTGSSSSRSKGKDKRNKYQKMASPPPPQSCNSIPASPIGPYHAITPPTKFGYSNKALDLHKRGAFRPKITKSSIGEHSNSYMSVVTPEQVL